MGETAKKANDQNRINIAREVCFSPTTEDGCIVLNVERGTVLSLNDTGALMFSKLAASNPGLTRDEFVTGLTLDFADVDKSRIESSVDSFLHQLDEKKVLQKQHGKFARCSSWLRASIVQSVAASTSAVVKSLLFIKAYTPAAVLLLTTSDVILKFAGFTSLYGTVKNWKLGIRHSADTELIAKGCATVERACTWHPKQELCLQRSAVAACLLRSLGVPAEMVIGVRKMPFYGHAWVEVEGNVVNDHKDVQAFFHVLSRC